jgi:riboflavin synthase
MSEEIKLNKLKLEDNTIVHIIRLLQLGIITGTDIVDHFRMIELVADEEGNLHLDKDYADNHEANIEKMVSEAAASSQEASQEGNKE